MTASILNRSAPNATEAMLRWLDPPRQAVAVDGVVQPACSSGSHVVANLPISPDLSREVAGAIDEWLLGGRLGVPSMPQNVPHQVARIIGARVSGMALPNMARPLSKAITHREVHTGRLAKQKRNGGKTPKWKKDGLVGPGGAWAVAQRKAKNAGKPKAYANAIYAKITGK